MNEVCQRLHEHFHQHKRFCFPYEGNELPLNGICILYEKEETGHGGDRIVRVGSHTGVNKLRSRIKEHFMNPNKDRSIFRKNIGRCFLNKNNDPYLKIWELALTKRADKEKYQHLIDVEHQKDLEQKISQYIQQNFSFSVIQIEDKNKRLNLESKLISTVSLCNECKPSPNWLGLHSPKEKIRESGLWQVNHLYKESLSISELQWLEANTT